ncbi:BgTH12-06635 [Blumeria graminis f. sp. triticale]|uniref:BgTH12-06635 n=1 Tax=Blumeria graminis f. sp. triticale TaxID=1689686 RepID=A0A9W4GDN6_BLUGR|nr:BgTH12-06635 [Blumeria graminis f. sp. triticale]
MRIIYEFIAAVTSIMFIFAVTAEVTPQNQPEKWPLSLFSRASHFIKRSTNRRRDIDEIAKHAQQKRMPIGIMKMSPEEGEKFFATNWLYDGDLQTNGTGVHNAAPSQRDLEPDALIAPFTLHSDSLDLGQMEPKYNSSNAVDSPIPLKKRDFKCPKGTSDCSAIGHSNSCCSSGDVCYAIQDTGLGPVGCCPKNKNCSGKIMNCDSPNTACPASQGGGCCIPDYACATYGCIIQSTLLVTTVITVTAEPSSHPEVTTIISTLFPTQTCETTHKPCTESPEGDCGSGNGSNASSNDDNPSPQTSASHVSSDAGAEPVRPTGISSVPPTWPLGDPEVCPTGFYACKAFHAGGCCRVGRNCDTTSCPPTASTSFVSGGVTVVAPVTSNTSAKPTGTCAQGWNMCPSDEGGKCCPVGWQCGVDRCSNVGPTSTGVIDKEDVSLAGRQDTNWLGVVFGISILVVIST